MNKKFLFQKIIFRIIVIIIPFFIHPFNLFSQKLLSLNTDTICNQYQLTGELDSVDAFTPYSMSSYPQLNKHHFSTGVFSTFCNGASDFFISKKNNALYYTSLPHLGFAYTFGAQGFQSTKVNYYQTFRNHWILNINILRGQATGLLRNSEWKDQSLCVQLKKKHDRFSSYFDFEFSKQITQNNGGVIDINEANDFAPEILSINKSNAYQEKRLFYLKQENYFNLFRDSTFKAGIYNSNTLDLNNRKFYENDTLFAIYQNNFFDTLSTQDDLQNSSFISAVGFFSKSKKMTFTIAPKINIWSYHIAQMYRDTIELNLNNSFNYSAQSFDIKQFASYNLIGANKGWKNLIQLKYSKKSWDIHFAWTSESRLPELYKRHYFSNNYFFSNDSLKMQSTNRIDCSFSLLLNKQKIKVSASYLALNNPYLFHNNQWTPDLYTNLNVFQGRINALFKIKFFSASPYYVINILPSGLEVAPSHQIGSRLVAKGGVFKAKKLILYGGIEPIYLSSFRRMAYIPSISSFSFSNPGELNKGYIDLRVFAGLELDSFRFFARAENLGYLWTDNSTEIMQNFPIPTVQIRLGITWDFWN